MSASGTAPRHISVAPPVRSKASVQQTTPSDRSPKRVRLELDWVGRDLGTSSNGRCSPRRRGLLRFPGRCRRARKPGPELGGGVDMARWNDQGSELERRSTYIGSSCHLPGVYSLGCILFDALKGSRPSNELFRRARGTLRWSPHMFRRIYFPVPSETEGSYPLLTCCRTRSKRGTNGSQAATQEAANQRSCVVSWPSMAKLGFLL